MSKIKRSEQELAEKKYRSHIEERDKLNEQVRALVEEKKILYQQKDKIFEDLGKLKQKKKELAELLQKHKANRNEFQSKAKDLINEKRKKTKNIKGRKMQDLDSLEKELEYLIKKQETSTLSIEQENELIDDIRKKAKQLGILMGEAHKNESIQKDVETLDDSIDQLFKSADEEHAEVIRLAAEIHAMQDEMTNHINEVAHVLSEIKKKQELIDKIRAAADDYHKKALAMREKVVTVKKERWKEIQEGRRVLEDHHRKVRKELDDQKKLDAAAELAVQDLFKKGRIEL